jgi:Rha family phage regulatory protein
MSAELIRLTRNNAGELVVSSLVIAELFDKPHKNVLRAIENIEIPPDRPEWAGLNFEPGSYADAQGQQRPAFDCTEAGALMVTMGFTGAKAAACRIRLIERFQAMRAELRDQARNQLRPQSIETRQDTRDRLNGLILESQRLISDKLLDHDDRLDSHDRWLGALEPRIVNLERITPRNPRKEISADTRRDHLAMFALRGGRCPYCEVSCTPGEIEIDHFYANTRAKFEETWPLCRKCHRDVTDGKVDRLSYERAFAHYQDYARKHRHRPPAQLDWLPA